MPLPAGLTPIQSDPGPMPSGLTPNRGTTTNLPAGLTALPRGLMPIGDSGTSPTPDVQYDIPQEVMNSGLMAYPTQDQRIAMIPTQDVSGRIMSPQEAIDQYHKTGKAIGVFSTPQEANQAIKFWQDESAQTPQARQFAAQQAQMMPSHQPTVAPMPMFAAHQVNPKSALQKAAQLLVGSDNGMGLGDWNPKAMAANIFSNMDNTLANSAGWLAERFKDMQSSLGSSTLNQAVPSLSIMKNVLKSISPKLDSDAIAQRALEHVQNYEQGLAQQAQSWAPQGYQPGLVGKLTGMAGPVAASIASPATGAALFGTSMGNVAQESAKASGASPADQELMGLAGTVGGGITGMFGLGSGELGAVAPTLAERGSSAATASIVGGGVTAGMNVLEKLLYNPNKDVSEGVSENALMMGIIGAAHASGNPITEEQATGLARFAKENPEAFAKQYGDTLKSGITQATQSTRTPDQIRAEATKAARNGDMERVRALDKELGAATTPSSEAIPVGPEGTVFKGVNPYGVATRPEMGLETVPKPVEAAPEQTLEPTQPERRPGVEFGLTEQADTIEALNQRRQQLLTDIQSADEQAQQAARKRGPEGRRIAQKTSEGLRQELADVEQRISENTGKSPDEMGWENTKQAWDNLKAEMQKPGSQRGAIGNLPPEEGTADIPQRLVDLANAAAKDGVKNASDWVATMKKQLSDEDFDRFYTAVGGIQGAHGIWSNQADITPRQSEIANNTILSNDSAGWKSKDWNKSGDITRALRDGKYTNETLPDGESLKVLHMDSPDGLGGRLLAFNNRNQPVGDLDFSYLHGENPNVFVDEANRRRGIATMLYQLAAEKGGKFPEVGSENAVRSDEGQALRESMAERGQLNAGLNIPEALRNVAEAAKRELGLPEGATDADLASEVMSRIGKLGSSVKETVVRIMSKIKGIGRDLANTIAEHLHKAVSGTQEGQLGAIGEKPQYTPEEEAHYQSRMQEDRGLIAKYLPGDENKSARAEAYKKLQSKASVISDYRKANAPQPTTGLQYRQTTPPREGSVPDAINQFLDQTFRRAFPTLVDQAGSRAGDIIRYEKSKASTDIFRANMNIRSALIKMASSPLADREVIADAIESPEGKYKIHDPKVSKAVAFVKGQSKELGEALKNAGLIKGYIEDYLHHAFKETPEQVEMAIKKKSPTGNLGYLIERHGPDTYAIARDLGLTPKESNPFQNFFDDFVNKQKLLVANGVIKSLMAEGMVTKEAQLGFVKLNDYLRNAVSRSKAGEAGEYYAPKSVADLLNNHLGEGFERNIGFRALRGMNNSMNHVQLGMSFFHGMFIMRDMSNTLLGSGITAIARGDFKEGFRQLALGASPIYGQNKLYQVGKEFRDALASPDKMTPDMQEAAHTYQLGGGRPDLDPEYVNDMMLKMRKAWEKAKDVKLDKASRAMWGVATAAEVPFAAVEAAAKPIMEHLVPNAKAGAFLELWKVESKRLPLDATDTQKAIVARKLVNDIDDRMGQLVYDNLHLPNAVRQSLTLTTRAAGWVIGSLRAIYGAAVDTARAAKMGAQDVAAKMGALSPETQKTIEMRRNAQGIWGPKDYMTQRMGYGVASAAAMAITNGMITYVGNKIRNATKKPEEKASETKPSGMDYVFPRIGDQHYALAGYDKEGAEQWKIWKNLVLHHDPSDLKDYFSQKSSPVVNLGETVWTGTDWRGNKISIPTAIGRNYLPFAASDLGTPELPTSSLAIGRMGGPRPAQTLGRLVGLPPAPKSLLQTDAENEALRILHEDKTPLSQQTADHQDFVNRMALYHKAGDDAIVDDAKKKGLLTQKDLNLIRLKSRDKDLLTGVVASKSVPPEEALKIYRDYATDQEKQKLRSVMFKKKMQARRDTPPANMEQWRKDWSVIK